MWRWSIDPNQTLFLTDAKSKCINRIVVANYLYSNIQRNNVQIQFYVREQLNSFPSHISSWLWLTSR